MSSWMGLTATGWTAITTIATIGLVVFAALTLRSTAEDSRQRSRPVLIPVLKLNLPSEQIDLTITNFGPSAALNASVIIGDAYRNHTLSPESRTARYREFLLRRYSLPIEVWAPSQVQSAHLVAAPEIDPEGESPMSSVQIMLKYNGPRRRLLARIKREHDFEESFTLPFHHDLNTLGSVSSLDLDQQMKKVIQHLNENATQARRIAAALESRHQADSEGARR